MDNRYQGQGQFGQNQQMPNQQMPNQQMPNQYGQGVNPNLYNMGNPNMQPNGQNMYGQNMYGQNMYGQNMYGFNNPIPPMDQATHADHVRKANKKKKIFMGFIIGAIIFGIVGFVAAIALVISLIFKTYDVEDYDKVAESCEEVFGAEMEKLDEEYFDSYFGYGGYDVASFAICSDSSDKLRVQIIWTKFENETDADSFYLEYTDEIEDDYEAVKDDYSGSSISSGYNTTKASVSKNGQKNIAAALQKDDCVLTVYLKGDKELVDDLYDEFLDELD